MSKSRPRYAGALPEEVAASVHGAGVAPGVMPVTLHVEVAFEEIVTVPAVNLLVCGGVVALKRANVTPATREATAATAATEPAASSSRLLPALLVLLLP